MTIQSDSSVAASYAQNIMNGANLISGAGEITKDGSSSLQGNSLASTYIDKENSNVLLICGQIKAFIANVQSTAAEFEAVDLSIAKGYGANSNATITPSATTSTSPTTNYRPFAVPVGVAGGKSN